MSLGSAKALSAAETRKRVGPLKAEVRLGHDPAGTKQTAQARAVETFAAGVKLYLACQERELRLRSYIEVKRHLMVHAKTLHRLPLSQVDRRAVAAVLAELATAKSNGTVNRVRSSLAAFYTWATRKELADADHNVVATTKRREEHSRARLPTHAEMREIWNALRDDAYGHIVKLLMLEGARRGDWRPALVRGRSRARPDLIAA